MRLLGKNLRSPAAATTRKITDVPWVGWILLTTLCLAGPVAAQQDDGTAAPASEDAAKPEQLSTIRLAEKSPKPLPAASKDDAASPSVLDTVTVTATRSREPLAKTPISVSVTPEHALRETNITTVENLSDRLPNAQLSLTPTNSFLFVRGLGTGSVRSAEQSVGFFEDNVFLGRPQAALFDFLDVDQVELLRGPQGALLGKNTVAGALNIKTAPVTRDPEGYAEVLGGSHRQRRIRGAYSDALSDTFAARVAYSQTDEDGVLYNTTQQRLDLARPGRAGRVKLQWTPTEDSETVLSIQAAHLRQTGDSFELSRASDQTLALYRLYDPQTSADITDGRTQTDHQQSGAKIDGQDAILTSKLSLGKGELQFIGSASRQDTVADLDLDVSPVPLLSLPSLEGYRQRSVELRYERPQDWGQFTAGVYYFKADLDLLVDIDLFANGVNGFLAPLVDRPAGVPLVGTLGQTLQTLLDAQNIQPLGFGQSRHHLIQHQATYAGFGAVRWDVSDRLRLQFDGRLSQETKRGDQSVVFNGVTGPLLGRLVGEQEYSLQADRSELEFSPRGSALFDITKGLSSYLTIAQGFKSGGFNNLAAVPERAEFNQEQSLTFEGGLRAKTKIGLSGSLTLFRTQFKNLQVAALNGTEFFVGNAARAHTQGAELSVQWRSPFGLGVASDLGYVDARYDSYKNAPARADSNEKSQDLSGQPLQRAPRFSGSVQVDFLTLLPWVHVPMALGVVAEGASHQFLNVDLDPIDAQPGYVRYNAYAAISDSSQRFTLRLIGRNLEDRVVRREAADVAIVGAHSVGLFPPRSFAAELGYRF